MTAPIRLIGDAVLLRLEKPERLSAVAKLWIPDTAQRKDYELYQATVLAAGPGERDKRGRLLPTEVQAGNRVLFYWASAVMDVTEMFGENGEEMRIVSEKSIQAVLND